MTDMTKLSSCQITCWSLSALSGVLILWASMGAVGVVGGLLIAIIVGLSMALLFTRLVCTGHSADDPGIQPGDLKNALKNVTGVTFYKAPIDEDDLPSGAPARDAAAGQQAEPRDEPAAAPRSDVGTRPKTLSGPRGGQPDDLKQIKGLGSKLEKACHDHGVYHFDQIAAWSPEEVAWVDENLVDFGRASRDDWVQQAKILAAGGETAFSARSNEDKTE